jgi:purine-nucleoside phosphorylase
VSSTLGASRPERTARPDGGASAHGAQAAVAAAAAVREAIGGGLEAGEPVAIVLGSGLGGLAEEVEGARRVAFRDVPGFPPASVAGHAGALVAGTLGGRSVVALAGRFHLYEGHAPTVTAFGVRVLHALGARTLFVSNAAGGIRRTLRPGDLMRIDDHVNLMWRNPLAGTGEAALLDMSAPYDAGLAARLDDAARDLGLPLEVGVYAALPGPTYETPAEVRMLAHLGADAVGMSTVPEVIVARALGMRVAGVSCITNLAAGLSPAKLSHAEVLETTAAVAARFQSLVREFVRRL